MKQLFTVVIFFISLNIFSQENTVESFDERYEAIKQSVKQSIDSFAFDEDSKKRRYKVVFEGDKMRLLIMKANGSAPINKGLVYDFSRVFQFDDISFRRKDVAYITYFLDKENYPKRKKWIKIKLIMKVFGHEHAETIMQALKDYNNILLEKEKNSISRN